MKILLIDNYDSFTYNVYQYLAEMGNDVTVARNDKISIDEIKELNPDAIFLSPGPGTPSDAGVCIPAIKEFAGKVSIFGICLGHQAIGEAFGGVISHAKCLMHGKTSLIKSLGKGVMKSFDGDIIATRYHSLVIIRETLPECLEVTCESEEGEIMGVIHKEYNIEGVQFHPESIMTKEGKKILISFLERTKSLLEKDKKKKAISEKKLTCLNSDYDTDEPNEKISITQYVHELKINKSVFTAYKQLQEKFGGPNCFLLESVSGPKIDCTKTIIGLFPQFEITLHRSMLKFKSINKGFEELLKTHFGSKYNPEGDGFNIGKSKFSEVFRLLSRSIALTRKHDVSLSIDTGLAGYFSYEYLHYIEEVPRKDKDFLGLPDVHLKYFPLLIQVEYGKNDAVLVENRIDNEANPMVSEVIELLKSSNIDEEEICMNNEVKEAAPNQMKSNITRDDYIKNVERAKRYIYDGDIFQVQLGQRILIEKEVEPLKLYNILKKINPSPYMFYWDNGDYQLLGDSPELQLKVDNEQIMIRPIAGTSKGKGFDEKSRNEILTKFKNDSKENAEHVMLVDLARNDIGRMSVPGSVYVSQLMNVEEFSHVFHLTSTVVGRLKKGLNSMEVFEDTFPAGTLTGAPKVRAMEIISELETEARGPYGGAFGFFDFGGNIISSIIIRTIVRKGNNLYLQASAGIVADSVPESELEETYHKMRVLNQAILQYKD